MTKARRELAALIPSQDVVIEVLDARLPRASSNPLLTELLKNSDAFRLALAGCIPDTAIDYLTIGMFAAQFFLAHYASLIVTRYKLTTPPESAEALLIEIGKRRAGLGPGVVVNLHKASELLIREFRSKAIGRISLEAP
jgi:ribosome biogenesis GTPase A